MYDVVIHKGEDFGYWADCPVLPGCISQGVTKEEVLANIREAIELYLEVVGEDNSVTQEVVYVSAAG